MIYKYYCVNCGNRFEGKDIRFDLFELIGIRDPDKMNSTASKIALVNSGVIKGNAGPSKLKHGVLSPITLSLESLFRILSVNSPGVTKDLLKQILQKGVRDENEIRQVFENALDTSEKDEVMSKIAEEYWSQINTLFNKDPGNQDSDKLADYKMTFYVKPEFFDNGNSEEIYTLEYKHDVRKPNTLKIRAPQPIRGYCPGCGEPILQNAGKYPHVLVGLLGAQSAGKTTMILSMLQDLMKNYGRHRIEYPGAPLCDSRFHITQRNQKMFNNGWLPVKTEEKGVNSFNASLLLEAEGTNKKLLVTFADIAGEQCYDPDLDSIRLSAVQKFPLINSCDVYILCSCLDNTQYIRADDTTEQEERIDMPPQAVIRIADGIFDNLRDYRKAEFKTPPLAIVMTKADVVEDAEEQEATDNPFDEIHVPSNYFFDAQFRNLSETYQTTEEEKVREPLEWCCKAFNTMKNKTYMSMMACSATGRVGKIWTKKEVDPPRNPEGRFKSIGVYELTNWVLKVIGLSPVSGNYRFEGTPSYNEHYVPAAGGGARYRNDHFTDLSSADRCKAVPQVFLNPSPNDIRLSRNASFIEESKTGKKPKNERPLSTAEVLKKMDLLLNE